MINFIQSFDLRILDAFTAHSDPTITSLFIAITEAGGTLFIGGLMISLFLFLVLHKKYAYGLGLLVSVTGAAGTTFALKDLIHRARPDFLYSTYMESGFSFPSGHSAISAALYGFCIFLLWRLTPSPLWRILGTIFFGLFISSIAVSRVYLGVHYLSDVFAGLLLGGLFAWIGIVVARKLETINQ